MKYPWLNDYMVAKKGVIQDFKEEWNNAQRYFLADKLIGMLSTDKEGKPIFTCKGNPMNNQFLRDQYKDIIAGYHMNKEHWISVYMEGNVSDAVFKEICDDAYDIILQNLSAKKRKEICA